MSMRLLRGYDVTLNDDGVGAVNEADKAADEAIEETDLFGDFESDNRLSLSYMARHHFRKIGTCGWRELK